MENISWSQKLFLKINKQVGKKIWLDWLFYFFARWLIYILFFVIISWGLIVLEPIIFKKFIKFFLTAFAGEVAISWLIALFVQHHRPSVELPNIKTLVNPMQNWKSFPSDHSGQSLILALLPALFGAPVWFVAPLVFLAIGVAFGRVYVGVHYPRDIIGGWILAIVIILLAEWLLSNLTQPVYNLIF